VALLSTFTGQLKAANGTEKGATLHYENQQIDKDPAIFA
jgi:hypothetical protein